MNGRVLLENPLSTAHNNALFLRPFDEIETSVSDLRIDVLPGRLAALSHPLNKGRTLHLPDKELYDPDLATVVSSGWSRARTYT